MQMNLQVNPAERLRELGIRPSPQRLAVYSYLLSHPVHPTADTIYQAIITAQPSLSRTTIYNTLKLLVHKKAVSTVIIEDGELRFDADLRPMPTSSAGSAAESMISSICRNRKNLRSSLPRSKSRRLISATAERADADNDKRLLTAPL